MFTVLGAAMHADQSATKLVSFAFEVNKSKGAMYSCNASRRRNLSQMHMTGKGDLRTKILRPTAPASFEPVTGSHRPPMYSCEKRGWEGQKEGEKLEVLFRIWEQEEETREWMR